MRYYGGSTAYFGVAKAADYYTGGANSTLVPDTFTVSLGGRPYIVDLSQPFYRQYHRQLAPLIRTQADTSKLPGETSLDPNGLWRRSFEDWSLGAGQRYLDRNTSINNGYWQSKGIDSLTNNWQITLLPDVNAPYTTVTTNPLIVTANGYAYVCGGSTLYFSANPQSGSPGWTAVTGTPGVTISSICTDGQVVYIAVGASGVYSTTAGTASAAQYVTSAIGSSAVIGYNNDRLMLGNNGGDGKLYNIVATGALPAALFAPGNTNATWVGFANGNTELYAAVNIGNQGIVYGLTVTTDGTALDAPTDQANLPGGEQISAIYGYLGNLVIGTSLGVRFATASSSGVNLGSLITGQNVTGGAATNGYGPTASVQCLTGYGPFVWFGWTDYDATSTGLGRINLTNFVVENDLPAFASDLMAPTQGAVTSVAVLNGVVMFGVNGVGVYTQSAINLVSSGTITSGYILYDMTDPKIAALLDIQTNGPLQYGQYEALVSTDAGAFNPVGTHMVGQQEPVTFSVSMGASGQRFEVQLILTRDGSTAFSGPTITRWTLRAYPAPIRPVTWQLPLIFDEAIINTSGSQQGFDPLVELEAIELMAANGLPVVYQEANQSYQVFVQDVEFLPDEITSDKHYFNGICLVNLEGLPVPYTEN